MHAALETGLPCGDAALLKRVAQGVAAVLRSGGNRLAVTGQRRGWHPHAAAGSARHLALTRARAAHHGAAAQHRQLRRRWRPPLEQLRPAATDDEVLSYAVWHVPTPMEERHSTGGTGAGAEALLGRWLQGPRTDHQHEEGEHQQHGRHPAACAAEAETAASALVAVPRSPLLRWPLIIVVSERQHREVHEGVLVGLHRPPQQVSAL
mmetsp:Transcript_34554/g.88664  ORF Transcript_34554/g.88664 Transcript_34554/m.88664 type:complete len:207 (+) Transcript_34554:125-745(+)